VLGPGRPRQGLASRSLKSRGRSPGSPSIPSTQRPPNIRFPAAPKPVIGIKLSPSSAFRPAPVKSPLLSGVVCDAGVRRLL
jgi:hypothetical protein